MDRIRRRLIGGGAAALCWPGTGSSRSSTFLGILLVAVLAASAGAFAQARASLPQVGVVFLLTDPASLADGSALRQPGFPRAVAEGLRERGWIDGHNVRIHWRSALDKGLEAAIDELVARPVDVLVVFWGGVEVAVRKTRSIPIVALDNGLVADGVVASLARPGGNVTGVSIEHGPELNGKRLALLKAAAPSVRRVAYLELDPDAGPMPEFPPAIANAAQSLGLTLVRVAKPATDRRSVERAFEAVVREGANGVVVTQPAIRLGPDLLQVVHEQALRHRLPVIHSFPQAADSGALLAFGFDLVDPYRRIPYFVDRILRGARPAQLPVEQYSTYHLVVNLRAAAALGLTIPPALILEADRVIR